MGDGQTVVGTMVDVVTKAVEVTVVVVKEIEVSVVVDVTAVVLQGVGMGVGVTTCRKLMLGAQSICSVVTPFT